MELCVQTGSHGFSSHHIFLMKSFIFKSLHLRLLRKTHAQTLPNLLSFVHVLWRYVQLMHFAVWGLLCFPLSRTRCSHKLPLTFNFLHTLTSLKFKTLFIFLSCKVAAVWSLLGLVGSGNAQVSFSLHTDFSQKRVLWLSGTSCALVCNLQQVLFSPECPFSVVAVTFLCLVLLSSPVFSTSSDCELFGQKFPFTMNGKLHLITRLCFQLILSEDWYK